MEINWGEGHSEALPVPSTYFTDTLLFDIASELAQPGPSGHAGTKPQKSGEPASTSGLKRERDAYDSEGLAFLLAESETGKEPIPGHTGSADDSLKLDDDSEPDRKKGKGEMSLAAKNKACRERLRRERLNEGFNDLAKLISPDGKNIKTDKASIICDAVRVVTQLRLENNQLKQLNKFLEERVAQTEKAKGQMLLQQVMMHSNPAQQLLHQQAAPLLQLGGLPLTALPALQQLADVQNALQAAVQSAGTNLSSLSALANNKDIAMQNLLASVSSNQLNKPLNLGGMNLQGSSPASYLPPTSLDVSQDHMLRPPAA